RKELYRKYAEQLVAQGNAYYAFDTPEELEQMRNDLKTGTNPNPQYDGKTRMSMRNSLTLPETQVKELLDAGISHVIRIKMPAGETISFPDMIRGEISNESDLVDDKVLLKADGMPTYHLAVVVDDYLMKITHAFRGEEWLPSAPVHILLWRYLGWIDSMPQWAHLPLILKPDGHGKLSKRDGQRLGFPVFAMQWKDPATGEVLDGFKEHGFLPGAFVNILAMLGWNNGTEQELFSLNDLVNEFSMDRVHKGGAKFDFDKAKWFNQQYIMQKSEVELLPWVRPFVLQHDVYPDDEYLGKVISLVKERCHLLTDFWAQGHYFFTAPGSIDLEAIKGKWNEQKQQFFSNWVQQLDNIEKWNAPTIEDNFNELAAGAGLKKGELMLPLRIMLVGGKYGPGVFDIAEMIGNEKVEKRINAVMKQL
ncbi:MAG TPA: glutamate--tRNA ligase, partial [Flavipsychrobacter sp.]|nr:glutamate--tRNA ligase [Flavipsychrobacter sp.]